MMTFFRQYLWLWVILGIIFVSVMISLIFVLINKWINEQGKLRILQLDRAATGFNIQSNKYEQRNPDGDTPALPPRTQFLKAEAQSYENLAEETTEDEHDYEEAANDVHKYEQNADDDHDYEEATNNVHNYEQNAVGDHDYEQNADDDHDYEENVDGEHDYEQDMNGMLSNAQSLDGLSDYVKVEDEVMILLPPPPYQDPNPADSISMASYDDIGGEDDDDGEDYDDVA
ncbi:uncharacterized protein LOC116056118 isoform X1 [Scomber scombrus]|uniref:Uncharacterized protein LOC116056118 isoform X1 n=1 Tax=Scomber scombrus TaxID=13677 RepID=A0AAV1NYB3_SCOSC|nr:probable DNA-directed RNA polymerase subunit delta [Scomber scombrus]